ncbi:hypothetical protein SCB71_01150 [Herbiconiux sp. KACC 21604]|uniref:hypothetical protein n=1 Tax=unclassified Herbiconiux TaxID=2618217 RepID=UPI001492965E|nr:hypothetical protein [Herbiconiux sp. SALV-R1]QJU55672.1 hypothetical protein HL652_20005 [Herbiconiux sp. SALV-R1]WPO86875.1 hypothetical protein SCB71_01150 [Herbiconiux sp. KACC 21604]
MSIARDGATMAGTAESTQAPASTGRPWSRQRIVVTSVVGGVLLLAVVAWIVYSERGAQGCG